MSTDIRQRNDDLYPRVVAGDRAAIDEMICMNMPIVCIKVDDLVGCFPGLAYLRDEMIGEGNLGLVESINKLVGSNPQKKVNPTGYINVAVQRSIGNLTDRELNTSDRTARHRRQHDQEPNSTHKVPDSERVLSQLDYDPNKEVELLDLILGCCQSDEERAIVDLRIKGYVDREIAKTLDIPLTTVFMLRRELYQRVLATGEVQPES